MQVKFLLLNGGIVVTAISLFYLFAFTIISGIGYSNYTWQYFAIPLLVLFIGCLMIFLSTLKSNY